MLRHTSLPHRVLKGQVWHAQAHQPHTIRRGGGRGGGRSGGRGGCGGGGKEWGRGGGRGGGRGSKAPHDNNAFD